MAKIEITTNIHCPLMCKPCPQETFMGEYGDAIKKYKMMSLDDFSYFLGKIPKHVTVVFSGMSEPFVNKDCTNMIRLSLDQGYNVEIYSTLFKMSEDDADQIISMLHAYGSKISRVMLHLPDANGNMPGWKYSKEYEAILMKFRLANKDRSITKISALTMDDNGAVHDKLKHLQIRLRTHGWEGNSRAGVLDDSLVVTDQRHPPTPKHDTPILCGRDLLYDNNMLLPNGDVLLCCQDWAMNHVIGNLFNNSYYEIFGSAEMSRIRKENMKMGFSDKSICRKCVHAIPVINDEKQTTKAINSKNNNGTMNSSITKKIKMALKHSRSGW